MPVAQVIRFDVRQAIGRPRRKQIPVPCVILQLHRASVRTNPGRVAPTIKPDEDKIAGRGRDPG